MKTTIEERERHALVVSPSEDLPCSVPELIVAERTEALAARLSQLEGSTRAALAKIEKALARHDGDLAELRACVRSEIQTRVAFESERADMLAEHERKIAKLVASHEGMGEIDGAQLFDVADLQRAIAERDAALVERDDAREALAEALDQRDGAMSDRSAFLHAGEQRALQLVEARAAIADLEARLAAMSRARDVCAVQRDALVGARDQCAAQRDEARAELHRVEQEIRAALARFDR